MVVDNDGDKALVVKDKLLTKIAKRNMVDIVPLAYNLKKAKAEQLSSDSMYQGMVHAYTGGNIGPISNNITKVWNSGEIGEEQLNVVKWLCFQNNAVIDYAKTLWLPEPPKEVADTIRSYTKAKPPNFFIYAKDKESHQVEAPNDSTMNRIVQHIPDPRIKFSKSISKFNYHMMMNLQAGFTLEEDNQIVKAYDYWNARQYTFNDQEENVKDQDLYKFKQMRTKIIADSGTDDINYIVNTLVACLYTVRNTSTKKALWACFGGEIFENLKKNLEGKGKICQVCGKRFVQETRGQRALCCSEDCSRKLKNQRKTEMRNS